MPLHPVIARLVETELVAGRKPLAECSVEQVRAQIERSARLFGQGPAVWRVTDISIPTRGGMMRARLLRSGEMEHSLVVYVHGGGWVAGSMESSEMLARHLANRSQSAVLLVDYRLAPEHPFPAGLEDTEDALRWAADNCAMLAGRQVPLVAAGDSAGANLVTVAAVSLASELDIALQVLFYPITDTDLNTESYRKFADGPRLTRSDMQWFISLYAPEAAWTDPRVAPLRGMSLACSPPAWIGVAEYDVLSDEGRAYAEKLEEEGVPVKYHCWPGLVHGFARMFDQVDTAGQAVDDAAAAILELGQPDS